MKSKKIHSRMKRAGKSRVRHIIQTMVMCVVLFLSFFVSPRDTGVVQQRRVYAASENDVITESMKPETLPSGFAGVVSVVSDVPVPGAIVKRIGTSCEEVMVGQRFQKVKNAVEKMDVSSTVEHKVNTFNQKASSMAAQATMMTDYDYENLLRIVEAEAGTEDVKGRVLIANVIMNRLRNEEFPNNVTDVIWEVKNGVAQFSPIYDGTIYTVTISEKTREAVKRAMEGEDYSEGALFFIQRNAADKSNVSWFDTNLQKLFKHGVHEFYKYPEESVKKEKEAKKETKTEKESKKEKNTKK